jgi:hypothetical protein
MPLSKHNESNMNAHDSTSKIIKINVKLKSKVVYAKIKIESKRSCTWAWKFNIVLRMDNYELKLITILITKASNIQPFQFGGKYNTIF